MTQNAVFINDLSACLGALLPAYLAPREGRAHRVLNYSRRATE